MNRSKIEGFASKARNLLKSQIATRVELLRKSDSSSVIIENKDALSTLEKKITEKGLESVIDEVAYTWFNRLIALRYMDAHGFNRPLVVTPLEGEVLPEILSDAMVGNIDTGILTKANEDRINKLLLGEVRSSNAQSEIYRILLVSKCNSLNSDIPMLFERISDYTDLLLPEDLLSKDAIIPLMCESLTDENCQSVEVIGWLYQYYIAERKDEVFAGFKKGKKATSKEIPAATQLFTPEWIVRYLVENSLGRLWMLNHPDSRLVEKMSYYIKPSEQESDYIKISSPEEIKVCDPCCGSGHMLTYCFDILFEIYSELGYTSKDAVEHIIKDNLYGIELDNRAGQLSYFALMMKAREKARRFFSSGIKPNVCVLHNISFTEEEMQEATSLFNKKKNDLLITNLLSQYENADTLGSLITPIFDDIYSLKAMLKTDTTGDLFSNPNDSIFTRVNDVLKFSEFLSKRYDVVMTNPPYMGNGNMCSELSDWAKDNYPDSKSDLFAMFIERCKEMSLKHGYYSMVTMQSWMFLSGFENLRNKILGSSTITALSHMANMVMRIAFGTSATVFYNGYADIKGAYCRVEYEDIYDEKPISFPPKNERNIKANDLIFRVSAEQFKKIPGSPIAYWLSPKTRQFIKDAGSLEGKTIPRMGLTTGNNDKHMRQWQEVEVNHIGFRMSREKANQSHLKWFPYDKGGEYRKWYGNQIFVVNWKNDGEELQTTLHPDGHRIWAHNFNLEYNFKSHFSWSDLTSGSLAFRYFPNGFLFDSSAATVFVDDDSIQLYLIGYLNTNVVNYLADILNPSMHFKLNDYERIPYVLGGPLDVVFICNDNIKLSKKDWDSFESSWDFKRSPLLESLTEPSYEEQVEMDNVTFAVMGYLGSDKADEVFYANRPIRKVCPLEFAYGKYRDQANEDFYHLKMNEEELNRIFIDIYGLGDELKPEEEEKMVSIHRIYDSESEIPLEEKEDENGKKKKVRMPYAMTKMDVIEDFISYAVGCMFGRYSLDVEGLAYAGGEWDESKYSSFIPDSDNVIPVIADEWFSDDITFRFREFVKVTFGEESLSANMKFIEDSIGMSIRSYFVKEFYKHHLKIYKKRPIYWMFSSPKGYFNALVYLHRYNENTPNVVLRYLRQQRQKLSSEISALEREDNSRNAKTILNYKKIAEDLDDYERILYPIAMENISLDLDDGVKVNYAKLGNALKKVPGLEKAE